MFNRFSSYVEVSGLVGAILTTLAFLPQVVRTWQQGGKELSYLMLTLFIAGTTSWLLYGALGSLPIILANSVTAIQVLLILTLKLRCAWRREEVK
jgi:MtN3 and saliva related transmembrane protein